MIYNYDNVPTPCFVVEEELLIDNLKILKKVIDDTGCKILLAQKCFSMFSAYPLISKYISGTTASGLYEAKLGREYFDGERYVQTARLVWDRLNAGAESVNAASLISSFETQEEQEAAAAMLNMRLEGVEDRNDRAKTLRELVYFIKQASMDRMTQSGGAGSLQSLLEAKQQLQALRSARFQL